MRSERNNHQANKLMELFKEVNEHKPEDIKQIDEQPTTSQQHEKREETSFVFQLPEQQLNEQLDEILTEAYESKEQEENEDTDSYVELDVLNLPPRREVHQKPKQKIYFSLAKPVTRFIFVIIILIGLLLVLFFFQDQLRLLF